MERDDAHRRLMELRPELVPELARIGKIVSVMYTDSALLGQQIYTSVVLRAVAPAAEVCVLSLGAPRASLLIQAVIESEAPEDLGTIPLVTVERLHNLGHELAKASSLRRLPHRVKLYKHLGYAGANAPSAFCIPPLPELCSQLKIEAQRERQGKVRSREKSKTLSVGVPPPLDQDEGSPAPKTRAMQIEEQMQAARASNTADHDLRANLFEKGS